MKKSIAILLTLCLLLQCAVQLGIMGMYQLNKGYIAKNLCENRDKPQLKCNGQCQLRKQLKKASQQQQKEQKQQREEVAGVSVFVVPEQWVASVPYPSVSLIHSVHYSAPEGVAFSADIFHPPQV